MTDKQPKPKHKRMTAKECQAEKEQRAVELAATIASIRKYVPQTAQERQEERDRYQTALVVIGEEIERLEAIEQLDKLLSTEIESPVTILERLWKL